MGRKLLLAFLVSMVSILPAHAEWIVAECSAYTLCDAA